MARRDAATSTVINPGTRFLTEVQEAGVTTSPPEAPVRSGILGQNSNVKRGRGRPKLTWVEAIKRDLKGWNIPKDLALDRSAWKTAIHVPEP